MKNELKRGSTMLVHEEENGSFSGMPSSFPKQEERIEVYIWVGQTENVDAIMRTIISVY